MTRWTRFSERRRSWALVVVLGLVLSACGGGAEAEGELLPPDPDVLTATAAKSMGEVTSVRFEIDRGGDPVYIDSFQTLALDSLIGTFVAPSSANALLTVRVNDNLNTKLGAIAIDDEIWLSNPVTGDFETLPDGYDLDPSTFFDPKDGWRPLLAELEDVELVGDVDRDGPRYHIRGTALAERVEVITAGLVKGQSVTIDFWLKRDTALVTAAEFETVIGNSASSWTLGLSDYGEDLEVEPPPGVARG